MSAEHSSLRGQAVVDDAPGAVLPGLRGTGPSARAANVFIGADFNQIVHAGTPRPNGQVFRPAQCKPGKRSINARI
ncbi:hypothetical protein [Burkholderia stagnalis]|uniref:hypothetical protein n=1 Tax=Burkholderia stagnalis TaxID=1503054 RepID=UPI0012D9E523|nr:hypothetical protein [Burkholderia stagnalis]MDY7804109.1 hypothetical protein [Burkholderia stagnalis]